jgi:hypothetical protein
VSVLASASTSAFDQPGTLGFLVVAGMGVILVFLFRSMTKHLRKVSGISKPGSAGPADAAASQGPQAGSPQAGAAAETSSSQNE